MKVGIGEYILMSALLSLGGEMVYQNNYEWSRPGYHYRVYCQNSFCPFVNADYFDNLTKFCFDLVENCTGLHIFVSDQVITEFRRNSADFLQLTDCRLRNRHLLIANNDQSSSAFSELARNIQCPPEFSWEHEILLWCLLNSGNLREFKELMGKMNNKLPICLKSSLLFRAVSIASSRGLRILLEASGTSLKEMTAGQVDEPLLRVFFPSASTVPFESQESESEMMKCFETLSEFGSTLMTSERYTEAIPLHFLSDFALRSMLCSRTVVKLTPIEGLSRIAIIDRWKRVIMGAVTPMESAIVDSATPNTRTGRFEPLGHADIQYRQRLYSILMGAALPLLQAGSQFRRDPLEDPIGSPELCIIAQASLKSPYSEQFVSVLLSSRFKSSLNIEKFHKNISQLADYEAQPQNSFNSPLQLIDFRQTKLEASMFETLISNLFPLNLQQQCRLSVIRHMPLGLESRTSAINSLALPDSLKQFLQFQDYN